MTTPFFKELCEELKLGATEKGHPFRYFVLGTLGLDNSIGQRMLVLRKVYQDLRLTFYTDNRSPKIAQLQKNNTVSGLFYNPTKMTQLRIEGKAIIETNKELLKANWDNIPINRQKEYNTSKSPGDSINNHTEIEYLSEKTHFSMVHIIPDKMDFLKLGNHYHTRVQFSLVDDEWKGKFSVP
ncbi:pyridoxamine 5'-phosphate oxidase family protein [Flagellimonas sp. CMM7]|uniref:pyridoxamine 5'-phosphate oxidase family protein n=1 Tax=Flagellimonas sp. CMM7 TaxID=2654676 RepID=UPI0013D0FF09|nr:pyridoxamine 5'-phosphate oxidase family protein [Flagellimonas sp. CMM7]UII80233.1 pyridoxamine 5'-phosphate oxidase family protein [Flagellimonas sp. CMM7]